MGVGVTDTPFDGFDEACGEPVEPFATCPGVAGVGAMGGVAMETVAGTWGMGLGNAGLAVKGALS